MNTSFNKLIGTKIRDIRNSRDITMKELGNKVGLSEATIQRYESRKIKGVDINLLKDFAAVLGVSPSYLMGWEDKPGLTISGTPSRVRDYPYIPESVAAGTPTTIEGLEQFPTMEYPDSLLGKYAGNNSLVLMHVNGESMNKVIPNGSTVGVLFNYPLENLKNGDLVIYADEYEYSLKHFYRSDNKIIFRPNSTCEIYADAVYDKDNLDSVTIIGKVIAYNIVLS